MLNKHRRYSGERWCRWGVHYLEGTRQIVEQDWPGLTECDITPKLLSATVHAAWGGRGGWVEGWREEQGSKIKLNWNIHAVCPVRYITLTLGAELCLLEVSPSSTKSTWNECPLFRMPLALEGSYLSFKAFREESYWASLGTMSIGDCRGPSATGKSLAHLSGPVHESCENMRTDESHHTDPCFRLYYINRQRCCGERLQNEFMQMQIYSGKEDQTNVLKYCRTHQNGGKEW